MDAKKIIFAFFVLVFLISGNIFAAGKPAVIVFTAPDWCGPCNQMDPYVQKLKKDGYPITFVFLNNESDQNKNKLLVEQMRVTGLPTVIVMGADGREADRLEGGQPSSNIKALLDRNNVTRQTPTVTPTPKPKPTNNKPLTTPTKPPSIPVPKEQLPNNVFTERMKCALNKKGVYECQLFNIDGTPVVDDKGRPQKIDVDPNMVGVDPEVAKEARDLFRAIAKNQPDIDFFRSPTTGAIRPLPADASHLTDALPCPKPVTVPPGLSLIPITPAKPFRSVYTFKSATRVGPLMIGGSKYEIIIERCDFDSDGNGLGCKDESTIIEGVSIDTQAKTTAAAMVADKNKNQPVAPKSSAPVDARSSVDAPSPFGLVVEPNSVPASRPPKVIPNGPPVSVGNPSAEAVRRAQLMEQARQQQEMLDRLNAELEALKKQSGSSKKTP